jgi:rhamnulokinase
VAKDYLAFDLGAESGRAMLASFSSGGRSGKLELREIHRFPNTPLHEDDSLRWDIRRLWAEMQRGLAMAPQGLQSIGVDTWGVDFALLGADGGLLENPYHYRDRRTDGMMDAVFEKVSRERIYEITGIQFLPFNTLFQLYAACHASPGLIEQAESLLMIPDLLNYWLTSGNALPDGRGSEGGSARPDRRASSFLGPLPLVTARSGRHSSGRARPCPTEYTIATTTQLVDAKTRSWAVPMMEELGLPARLFPPIVQPGTEIGRLNREVAPALGGVPVIAPACHDTGSAVAAIAMSPESAFLSSGTWSLLGAEVSEPVITPRARDLNFTNEGGVCGTIRLLKNIAGLWLLQSCMRCWAAGGQSFSYDELLKAAERESLFRFLIDPDDAAFLNPEDMPGAIEAYCAKTGQPAPQSPAAYARGILESLALKYRVVLESLEEISGRRFKEIRIMGGGSRNRLLNQFTADATGRTVIAGPVEATALGNIVMQMLATGAVGSLAEARGIIDASFPTERFEPGPADWEGAYRRFRGVISRE